jgi:disulfide bond formation protein DsbB
MIAWLKQNLLYIAWLQALVATLGSLFFSEVMHWTPCVLCWYQRILMYPLVAILTVGILLKDRRVSLYVLPLSILGFLIAAYHNLLYYGVIQEVCAQGVSCTTRFFAWFGFITIPFLSLVAFAVITTLMLIHRKDHS